MKEINMNVINVHLLTQDTTNKMNYVDVIEKVFDDRGISVYFDDTFFYKQYMYNELIVGKDINIQNKLYVYNLKNKKLL